MDNRAVFKMTPGRAALVGLMNCYLRGLLDPFVTLLEVHKLMYFMQVAGEPLKLQFAKDQLRMALMQVAGEPLKLQFAKATYGPYAENLRHVLNAIEGHLVSGYADGGDAPDKELELIPGAFDDAQAFLENASETHARFERVSALIEGFESSFGLELLSTVHWIASEEKILDFDDIVNRTYAWNERKKQFSRRQIKIAFDILSEKGWIEHSDVRETAHLGRTSHKK